MKRTILSILSLVCVLSLFAQDNAQQTGIFAPITPDTWENPTGKYTVIADDEIPGLPEHTIFYPSDLSAFPENDNLPVLVMSGPGCEKTSAIFRPFFTELASHGYMMIVSGPLNHQAKSADGKRVQTTKQDMLDAIDWAWEQNFTPGSKFYGKIDLKHISAMGQSCGGIQALDIMNDPRITLLTLFNSGLFASSPGFSMGDVMSQSKDKVFANLRVPIAYFVGDTDGARQNATDDFKYIKNVPVFVGVREIPGDAHGGTFKEKNGGAFAEAAVAWLNWNFKGDEVAGNVFKGAPCGLEQSSTKWIEVRKRNIDSVNDQATDWPNFRRYENANDKVTVAPEMVLMGDSITDYWYDSDTAFFEQNNFVGRGIAGQTVSQMLVRFKQDVLNLKPKYVAIMAATNDICQGLAGMAYYPEQTMLDNTFAMCELAEHAGIKVLLCSVTPCEHYMPLPTVDAGSVIFEYNKKLKAYADTHKNVTYVDYWTPMANEKKGLDPDMSFDGVHPKINGYLIMENALIKALKSVNKSKKEYYIIPEDVVAEKKAAAEKEREERMKQFSSQRRR